MLSAVYPYPGGCSEMEVSGGEEESGPCQWVFSLSAFGGGEMELVGEEGSAGGLVAFL